MQKIINKEIEFRNLRAGEYCRRKQQQREEKIVNARWELAGWVVMVILVVVVSMGALIVTR